MEMKMGGAAKGENWALLRHGMLLAIKKGQVRDAREKELQSELERIAHEKRAGRSLLGEAVDSHKEKKEKVEVPIDWPELEVQLISKTGIRFRGRKCGRWIRATMAELKLNDGRREDHESKLWGTLELFALYDGKLNWGSHRMSSTQSKSLVKNVERLSKKLKNFFRIKTHPFMAYRKEKQYECRFDIADSRPKKTRNYAGGPSSRKRAADRWAEGD
jgi:hypothetical protein